MLAERVLEARRARVEQQLLAHPELRRAFDVTDPTIEAGPGNPISVVLAVRHGDQILSGQLHIPRARWSLRLFLASVDSAPNQERPA